MELDPVDHHLVPDEVELFFGQVEEDRVADEVALVAYGNELLRIVDLEAGEAVDAEVAQQTQGVATADEQVGHVVGLVEQGDGAAPGLLLGSPVAELRRYGKDRGPRLCVAQKLHGASRSGDRGSQRLGHVNSFVPGSTRCAPVRGDAIPSAAESNTLS